VVKVISGNYKGSTGKILFVDRKKGKVLVEGVNIINRHMKPTQKNPQGGILKREAPIAISKVMFLDQKTNEPTRLGVKVIRDESTGETKRMRYSVKTDEIILS
jgi:large subunit ribosomal protein L24